MRETSKLNLVAQATNGKKNIFATPAERVQLLKLGIQGTDIETLYVHMNRIKVRNACWQDGHVTGSFLVTTPITPTSRHVSSPVSGGPCAVEMRA
jgi:prepilin-type processing-associated H-X9-DG protein